MRISCKSGSVGGGSGVFSLFPGLGGLWPDGSGVWGGLISNSALIPDLQSPPRPPFRTRSRELGLLKLFPFHSLEPFSRWSRMSSGRRRRRQTIRAQPWVVKSRPKTYPQTLKREKIKLQNSIPHLILQHSKIPCYSNLCIGRQAKISALNCLWIFLILIS